MSRRDAAAGVTVSDRATGSTRVSERDRMAQPAAQSAPAEPVIVVTIGRIEVRAVAAAAPMPVPTPSAPRLSLEEYLRTRDGTAP